jgi:hypothetical protein
MSKFKIESAYEWVTIPEDLPKSNLFYVTAKTASPAIHPEDKEDPIRQFALSELQAAGRSLGRRFINMNHNQQYNIETAFTVDAQYNPTTQAVEALIYVPDRIRDQILRGEIKKASVEYVWRDIRKTEVGGSEFIGIIFDKIALLEESWLQSNGFNAGDSLSEIRKCESKSEEKRAFLDGKMEAIVIEIPPEQGMKQDMITEGLKNPEQGFYNAEKCKECGKLSECSTTHYKECSVQDEIGADELDVLPEDAKMEAQKPEGTNVMPIAPDGPVLNQTPVSNEKPKTNVASAGMVEDKDGGVMFGKPEETNPHKNLDMPKAPANVEPSAKMEGAALSDSTPIATSNEINVIGMDETKQKVESAEEPKKEEKKPEPAKPIEPVKPAEPVATPVQSIPTPTEDYKAKFEAVAVELKTTKEHEAFLEGSCKQFSDNAKLSDEKIAKATKEAYVKGKQEVIAKIQEVIPIDSQFGYNIQNSTRSLITSIKKKCYECSEEK